IPLFLGPGRGPDPQASGDERLVPSRGLLALVGISALLLAMLRQTGPLWLAVGVVAFAFPVRGGNLVALLRDWVARCWAAAVVVAVATAVVWGKVMKTSDLGDYGANKWTYGQAVVEEANRWRGYLDQMVGVTSWLDTQMPAPPYLIWQYAAAALVVVAVVFGRWVDRWRLAVLLLGAVAVPSVAQVVFVRETGFVSQGRYMLPMLAGVLIFAAYVLEERGFDAERSRNLVRFLAVLLLPIHLFCLLFTMVRWQHGLPARIGLSSLDPFAGPWHPVVGSVVPLVASLVGTVLFGALAWILTGTGRPAATAGPAGPVDPADASRA
ncbi:MAG TPA: DUF2142 domain-containing protein, partial [Micromonospora sp.]